MARIDLFTERNLLNSVGTELGAQLLAAGYLVYYLTSDLVQTPDGIYPDYAAQAATYAGNSTFAARLAAAKGLVTLHDGESAFPRFVTRPTNEGNVGSESEVQVPVFGISVDADVTVREFEFGARSFWRHRALHIDGRARTRAELQFMKDALSKWFDEQVELTIVDHDGTSGEAPGSVMILRRVVTDRIIPVNGDQDRFQLELHARLEYVA